MKTTGLNSLKSWGVAVACCVITLIALLPLRLSGLVFIALMEGYNVNRKVAAQPLVVAVMMRSIFGPVLGYLCGIFECQTLIICGSILSFLGVGACFFAEDMTYVILSVGLIYGMGMAFASLLVPIVIKQHFDKQVSRANGLTLIGSSVSAIAVPPFFEYLLKEYGTAGAFLITSGVMLNALPAAMLLKNPHYPKRTQIKKEPKQQVSKEPHKQYGDNPSAHEVEKLVTSLENHDKTSGDSKNQLCTLVNMHNNHNNSDKLVLNGSSINEKYTNNEKEAVYKSCEESTETVEHENKELNLPHKNANIKKRKLISSLKVFIDPSYLIILSTLGIQNFLISTIWTILIDLSRDKGIPVSHEIYFLMLLPVAGVLGAMSLTWVTDSGYLSSWKFCVVCYACLSISVCGLVWSYEFVTMMIAVSCFSFFVAAMATIAPVLIYEYIDEKYIAMAMSSRILFFIPLGLIMPYLIGYFRETLGSYDWLIYLLAIISLLCSGLFSLLPYSVSYKKKKKKLMPR